MLGFKSVGAIQDAVQPAFDAVGSAVSAVANSDVLAGMPDPYGMLYGEDSWFADEKDDGTYTGVATADKSGAPDFDLMGPRKGATVPVGKGEASAHVTREDDGNGSRRGLTGSGQRTTKVGGQEIGGNAEGSVDAGWTATDRLNDDGTITIEGSADLTGDGTLTGKGGATDVSVGAGGSVRASATVVVTQEQLARAMEATGGDLKRARGLLLAPGTVLDPADMAVGESWGREVSMSGTAGLKTGAGLGTTGEASGEASRSVEVERTDEGFVVDVSHGLGTTLGAGAELEGAAVGAGVTNGRGRSHQVGVHIVLPPDVAPEHVHAIAAAHSPETAATLALIAGGTAVRTSTLEETRAHGRNVSGAGGEYAHTSESERVSRFDGDTRTESGKRTDTHAFDLGGERILSDEETASTTCTAEADGEWSCDVDRSRETGGLGWDGADLTWDDAFATVASALTATDETKDGVRLHQDQMDALIASAADPGAFDTAFVQADVRTYGHAVELRTRLLALENVPAELRYDACARVLADFTAGGGEQGDLQRAAAAAGAKRWEWPATIPEGEDRFQALEASVGGIEAGGDAGKVGPELDRLFMELQRADGFTIPQARADMLERVDALRARAHAAELASTTDPDARAELLADRTFQQRWTDLAVARALKGDEQMQLDRLTRDHWTELEIWRFYDRLRLQRAAVQPFADAQSLAGMLPDGNAIAATDRRVFTDDTGLATRVLTNEAPARS